jgi:predicted lysophospholipase L1 biosynthesis ABC-type transport system permease subunit
LANRFFQDGNALGKRVRRLSSSYGADGVRQEWKEPWLEIVGIVEDYPEIPTHTPYPKAYLPLRVDRAYPIVLAVRANGIPTATAVERVRSIAFDVDPSLRFGVIRTLEDRLEDGIRAEQLGLLGLVLVTVSVVLLSTAGIYALMSFTVTRRRREIGIRSALGAGSGRVLAGILKRAMWQIGTGVAIGVVGAPIIATLAGNSSTTRELVANALVLIATMLIVGLLATIGPARRALRVHPTEALRAE